MLRTLQDKLRHVTATAVAVPTITVAALQGVVMAAPAQAQLACAIKMTVATGQDDLRSGSTFAAWLIVRQPTGQPKWRSLHTNGDSSFGDGGLRANETRVFWVSPWGATPSGSGCPESGDIVGVSVSMDPDLDFFGFDGWQMTRFTLQDSVNGQVYWNSLVPVFFAFDGGRSLSMKDTSPLTSNSWQPT